MFKRVCIERKTKRECVQRKKSIKKIFDTCAIDPPPFHIIVWSRREGVWQLCHQLIGVWCVVNLCVCVCEVCLCVCVCVCVCVCLCVCVCICVCVCVCVYVC